MKLKKLLAAVTAAALAVSTMAVTSFTASAVSDRILTTGSYSKGTLEKDEWSTVEDAVSSPSITLDSKWGNAAPVSNYSALEIEYTCQQPSNIKKLYLVAQSGTMPSNGWYSQEADPATSGKITMDLTAVADKTYECLLVQIQPADTFKIGDEFDIGFEITSAKLIGKETDPLPSSVELPFDSTEELSLKVIDASSWNKPGVQKAAQVNVKAYPSGITAGMTYGDLKNTTVTLTGVEIRNFLSANKNEELAASDVNVSLYAMWGNDFVWKSASSPWDLSTITGVSDDDALQEFGYQLSIDGDKGGINDMEVNDVILVNPSTVEPDNNISIDITSKSIAVGEEFNIVITVADENMLNTLKVYPSTSNSNIATVMPSSGENGVVTYKVTGVSAGTAILTFKLGQEANAPSVSCEVTVTEEGGSDTPTGSITVDKDEEGVFTFSADVLALFENEKTQIVVKYNSPKGWEDIGFGFSAANDDWISASLPAKTGENTDTFTVADIIAGAGEEVTSLAGVTYGKIEGYNGTEIISVTVIPGKEEPGPDDPPATGDSIVLWEGSTAMSWTANVQVAAAKFADIAAGDTLKFTFTCEDGSQIKIMSLEDKWPTLEGPNPDPEWGVVNISGTDYSFEVTAADVSALKEFGMVVSGQNYTLTKIELVPKATPKPPVVDPDHTHTPADAWTKDSTGHWHACSGCTDKVDFAAHTFNNGEITTPATSTTAGVKTFTCTVCGYTKTESIPATGTGNTPAPWNPIPGVNAPVIPTYGANIGNVPSISGEGGKSGWEVISLEIGTASDGSEITVDMNGVTKVPSTIFKDISGKDVDLVLNMGRGIKWTINGLSVTGTKTIDFDVTKNTRHIPDEVVEKAEGSYKKQISLDHKGSFGCNAVLTYDVGTKYNGLYANIFYYNTKTKELEFSDCSLISGGKANFVFTHASDYLITITEEPLGEFEDVSSAAGVASDDSSLGNGIVVSSVLAMIVLGFGIVVYKKRRHN